jgi:hypothetical protein
MSTEESLKLTVVARRAGVRVSLVRRYLEFGLIEPEPDPAAATARAAQPEPADEPHYHPDSAVRVAQAERLRSDLGLNYAGAVLVCELLDRIRELERALRPDRSGTG